MKKNGKSRIERWAETVMAHNAISCETCGLDDGMCGACDGCVNHSKWEPKSGNCADNCANCAGPKAVEGDRFVQDRLFAEKRPAATPEPMSIPGVDNVLPEVIKDLQARDTVGVKKYGTTLQTHNGRDALIDAYQEGLDKVLYLRQEIMQRSASFQEKVAEWANERDLYANSAPYDQMMKLFEEVLEWYKEVKSGDREKEKMELGDIKVVLANLAEMRGYDLDRCGWMAYNKIKDRTGHMENGNFIKDAV